MTGTYGVNESDKKLSGTQLFGKWICISNKRRGFKNKGALLILLWHFSASLVLIQSLKSTLKVQYCLLASMLLCPLAGWLADICCGRYKIIKYSMWIMWCSAITENVWILVKNNHSRTTHLTMQTLCKVATFVGLAGFQSNAIQFSIDQLVDASASEISSYISWHAWCIFLSKCILVLTQTCFCSWFDESFTFFIFPLSFTASLVSDILLNKWLIKEPVTQNPLKLIYRVLQYAVKNKYPRLRSAFTYWEDKPYRRIDLGKTKYGGPFSTEQVENVKSFLRIFLLVAAASVFVGVVFGLDHVSQKLQYYYEDNGYIFNCTTSPNSAVYMNNCILRAVVGNFSMFVVLVFVPLFEWILYPLIIKCTLCSRHCILHRFLLGMLLTFLYCISITSLEATTIYDSSMKANKSVCILHASKKDLLYHDGIHLDYKWLILPGIVFHLSIYILYTSGMEFVYAQTPYGMKGLVMGVVFFTFSLSIALSYTYIEILKKVSDISNFVKTNCGLLYYSSTSAFTIFCLLVGLIIKKKYTLRRRDDDTHNEQIFAVEYFDKYLDK